MKEPKIRFYLEGKSAGNLDRNQKKLVMASVSYGYSEVTKSGQSRSVPCRVSLGASILPAHFCNGANKRFDPAVFHKFIRLNKSVDRRMSQLKQAVGELERQYIDEQRIPPRKEFKEQLERKLNRTKISQSKNGFLDFLREDIGRYESGVGRDMVDGIKNSTIGTYRTLETLLVEYQLSTSEVMWIEDIDEDRYWNFWDVVDEILRGVRTVDNPNRHKAQTKKEHGYSVNSIRKYQDAFVKTLRRAKRFLKVELALEVKQEGLKLPEAPTSNNTFVDEKELQRIFDVDVSYDQSLQLAKDYIIISSLTGMRYQSMADTAQEKVRVHEEDGYNFKYIRSRQMKTETEIYMPLFTPVLEILSKYGGKFPKWPANGTINKKLKVLFEMLGIDDMAEEVIVTYHSGKVSSMKPKYKLITCHGGRRSFVTNLEVLKVRREVVDDMTHPDKKPSNIQRKHYDKRDLLTKAKAFVDEITLVDSPLYRL